jgi:hypothetical protein
MRVFTGEKSAVDLIRQYGIHKATAYRAVKRGYFCPHYHVKKMTVGDLSVFPTENAYAVARAVFYRHLNFPIFWGLKDDFIQEAVLRMVELSGISMDGKFLYGCALSVMRTFAKKNRFRMQRELSEAVEK